MLNKDSFYKDAIQFLKGVESNFTLAGLNLPPHWHIDHLCYRSKSLENYAQLKNIFSTFSELTQETLVNGRLIATYELHAPVFFNDHIITWVELPAPKVNTTYSEGFEHIEVVCDIPLTELPKKFPSLKWQLNKNPKYYNDEIKILFPAGAIKFHHQSLASVVALEKQTDVFAALKDSQILDVLQLYNPLVVGTFPLGLATSGSDIDIALSHEDLQDISQTVLKHYSHLPEFRTHLSRVHNRDSMVAQFLWKNIPIELFAQTLSSFKQNGYRHFIIEERLLKVGGDKFRRKVMLLREQGFKTEPAFAKALGLDGDDPFEALLQLHSMNDQQLLAMVTKT